MAKELFISSSPHETKVAILEDSELVEVYFERDVESGLVGGIYKGRVRRVLPGMQSAFVDIGLDRDAFLYVSDFFEDSEEYEKVVAEAEARVARYTDGRPTAPPTGSEAAAEPPGESAPLAVTPPAVTESAGLTPSAPLAPPVPPSPVSPTAVPSPPTESTTAAPMPAPDEAPALSSVTPGPQSPGRPEDHEYRRHDHRGRRRRHGRRGGFGDQREHRFGPPKPEPRITPHPDESSPQQGFELLPGESLAKYGYAVPKTEGSAMDVTSEAASAPTEARAPFQVEPQTAPETELLQRVETEAATSSVPVASTPTAAAAPVEPVAEAARPAPISEPAVQRPEAPVAVESASVPEVSAVEIEEVEGIVHEPVPFTEAITADWKLDRSAPAAATPTAKEEEPGETEETDEEAEELAGADEEPQEGLSAEGIPHGGTEAIPAPEGGTAPAGIATPTTGSEERSYTLRDSQQRPRYAPRRGRRGRRGAGQRPFRGPETPSRRAGP